MILITGGKLNATTITMAVIIRHDPHHRHHQRMVSCCEDRHIRHLTAIYNANLRFVIHVVTFCAAVLDTRCDE